MGKPSSFVLFSKMQGTSPYALRFCLWSWDGGRCLRHLLGEESQTPYTEEQKGA